MNNWKQSLDRFLTSGPPDNGYEGWFEATTEKFPEEFWMVNEDWCLEGSGVCDKWMNKCFDKGYTPEQTAELIQRAHQIYIS